MTMEEDYQATLLRLGLESATFLREKLMAEDGDTMKCVSHGCQELVLLDSANLKHRMCTDCRAQKWYQYCISCTILTGSETWFLDVDVYAHIEANPHHQLGLPTVRSVLP